MAEASKVTVVSRVVTVASKEVTVVAKEWAAVGMTRCKEVRVRVRVDLVVDSKVRIGLDCMQFPGILYHSIATTDTQSPAVQSFQHGSAIV